MRKRMLSWGLILSLLLTMLPVSAGAAVDHSNHSGWTQLQNSTQTITNGNYYLSGNVTSTYGITVSGSVTLCLNGHTLDMKTDTLTVSSGATLTICDCGSSGAITGTESYSNLNVISVEGGTLNLKSGTISSTAARSGSLISVTGGTLNVTGGTISLNHTGSGAYDGVQAVKLSNSTGSFTGGEVSLTTAVDNARATTVYQEGGSVTVGGSAEIVFEWTTTEEKPNSAPGYGALCVTDSGAVTINTGCTITASRTSGEMAGAVSIGTLNDATGTATINGGDINGFLVVYGEANISNGSFAYIENRGTLTMTGGTVENENENDINYGIWTSVTNGKTDLSNVHITAATGIYVNTGQPPTIGEGVTINATEYGVYGGATLVDAPSISGDTADLYIYSMRATTDYPSVDATAYTGGALTVQEQKFPDVHQGGYIGCAIRVNETDKDKFSLENSDGNFVYQYDTENSALRLYNTKSHPICGASCDHEDASHNDPAWQQWSTSSGYTLTGGSYYLTGTVTLSQPITVTGDVNFCLNGNTIKTSGSSSPFQVESGGSLTICDCKGTGQLTGGIAANGGQISIYGGTISGGAYAVDLGGSAKLTLAGSPDLSGTKAALKLYTKSGTTLENAAVDATDYTGGSLTVEEADVPGGANGFAIQGGENKFSLTNPSGGYRYAYEDGYVIRPDHTHSYTYSGSNAVITETCENGCSHSETATISIQAGANLTYTGSAITPAEVTYSDGWEGGKDLAITYSDNINAGAATATITKGSATASVTFTIGKATQAAPTSSDYAIDYINEKITSIANGCKVYTTQDAATEITGDSSISGYLGSNLYIRKEATDNYYASDWTTITLASRPAAPSVTAAAETIQGKGDGKVIGVDTTMEYIIDGGQNWKACTGNEITGLSANTTVTVRVKATTTAPHGEETSRTIPEGTATLTVTFDSNGGSAVTEITGLAYNAAISAPDPAPTKTGYIFGGWYKDNSLNDDWDFSSDKVTENITLYAKWTLEAPSVTITGAPEESVTYGTSVTLTASVTHNVSGLDYTYQWYKGDTELADQTASTLVLSTVADSGEYNVEVTATDTNGQTTTAEASQTVSITPAPVAIPDPSDMKFTYNGQEQTYPIADSELYTVTGNQQTDAGDYTVTVALRDKSNYAWAGGDTSDQTYSFTIARKAIAVTWSGLTQVYGTTEQVKATPSGIVSGDDVDISIAGVDQAAGSHPLIATLTGNDAANYTLKNGKETLTIRPKTVGFTVTDNAEVSDGTAKMVTVTPTDNTLTQTGYTVTYRQGAATVDKPTAVGSYEIWVNITDGNYRHTNGTAEMQVGTLTITQAPPVLYDVTFAGGADATGTAPETLSAVADAKIILPACTFERKDYLFTGWSYSGKIYQPGDSFTMPGGNVTFTAQWQHTYGITVTVREPKPEGEGGDMQTVSDAVVSLWLGANKLEEQTTTGNGNYTFAGLLPGIYNLVVTKGDRTVTSMVEITANDVIKTATLPKGATNSIVKVAEGAPDIVVGNLEKMFTGELSEPANGNYGVADAAVVESGGKVEITFTAEDKTKDTDETTQNEVDAIKEQAGASVTLGLVMDYKLEKEVFDADGQKDESASKPITESTVLLEIRLPLPVELQGKASYSVYRVHDNVAEAMEANPGSNEEGFKVDGSYITIYAKKFSTYAIGYTESDENNNNNGNDNSNNNDNNDDNNNDNSNDNSNDNNNNSQTGGGGGGGSSAPTYSPSIVQPDYGTVTVTPQNPHKGDTVTITPTPEDGYTVDTVTVTDASGKIVAVTPKDDGTYTFVQPTGKVTITVTFRPITTPADCPRDESCPMAPFLDADRTAWYHDGVHYCLETGLMLGTSSTTFAPEQTTSRAMVATILWRLAGSPAADGTVRFADVPQNTWYTEAVRWADSAGVVTGYSPEKFGPEDPITREQLAAMLWRYAQAAGADMSVGQNTDLLSYTDASDISPWATEAMQWACDAGILNGTGDGSTLTPQGQATRAQAATMLMRFCQVYVDG